VKTTNGKKYATLSLATNESWKKEDGSKGERTDWHRLVTFNPGRVALIEQYVRKGDFLYTESKMRPNSYEKNGETVYTVDVELTKIEFLSPKPEAPEDLDEEGVA
jgi:single-strand DNA-binding protein